MKLSFLSNIVLSSWLEPCRARTRQYHISDFLNQIVSMMCTSIFCNETQLVIIFFLSWQVNIVIPIDNNLSRTEVSDKKCQQTNDFVWVSLQVPYNLKVKVKVKL